MERILLLLLDLTIEIYTLHSIRNGYFCAIFKPQKLSIYLITIKRWWSLRLFQDSRSAVLFHLEFWFSLAYDASLESLMQEKRSSWVAQNVWEPFC